MMTTTKVKYKEVKDTKSLWFNELDYQIMTPKWNITQASSQSKAQANVYKNDVFDKT